MRSAEVENATKTRECQAVCAPERGTVKLANNIIIQSRGYLEVSIYLVARAVVTFFAEGGGGVCLFPLHNIVNSNMREGEERIRGCRWACDIQRVKECDVNFYLLIIMLVHIASKCFVRCFIRAG